MVTALGLGGCGGDGEGGGGEGRERQSAPAPSAQGEGQATENKPVATITVRETEFALKPANVTIPRPGPVVFNVRNTGDIVHALEVEGPRGEVETRRIQPGNSATLRADLSEPGKYTWYCPVGNHRQRGMEGTITVKRRAGGGSGESEPGGAGSGGGSGY